MTIADGWIAISGDRAPGILYPLIELVAEKCDISNLPEPAASDADELDAAIDGLLASGRLDRLAELSPGATCLLVRKISQLLTKAADAINDGTPFLALSAGHDSDQELLMTLIVSEIRRSRASS